MHLDRESLYQENNTRMLISFLFLYGFFVNSNQQILKFGLLEVLQLRCILYASPSLGQSQIDPFHENYQFGNLIMPILLLTETSAFHDEKFDRH